MANSDMLVRIKANTDNYNSGIAKAKRTLEGFKQENLTMGGIINQSTKSIVAAAAQYASFAAVLGTVASGFAEAVSTGSAMAREMEGVKMAFDRLNQPGLLEGLREATHGTVNDLELMKQAVKFDNFNLSLEQMGTFLAFAQQQAKDTGQDVNYLVDSIVTGLGRKSLPILDNLGLSATEIRERMKETGDMTKAVAQIIEERMASAGDYVETAADRAARATTDMQNAMMKLGETFGPITQNSDSLWNSIKIGAINALTYVGNLINYLHEAGRISKTIGNMNGGGMMERFGNNLRNSKDPSSLYQRQLAEINRSINSAEAKLQQAEKGGMGSIQIYRERVQALKEIKKQYQELYQTISRPAKAVITEPSKTKKSKGGSKKTLPTYDEFELRAIKNEQIIESEKEAGKLFKDMPSPYKMMFDEIKKQIIDKKDFDYGKDISTDWVVNSKGQLVNKKQGKGKDSESNFVKGIDNVNDTLSNVGGSINNIFGSLQQMGIEIPQGIASVLGALNIITSILTFIQSVVAIKSILPFANGGIVPHAAGGYMVPGNYYSGDVTPIMANAGELILNKSQQNNIASQLSQAGGGGRLVAKLRGRDILISLERELSETGKGQLATWR